MKLFNISDVTHNMRVPLRVLGRPLRPGGSFPIDQETIKRHGKKLEKLVAGRFIYIGLALPAWVARARRQKTTVAPEDQPNLSKVGTPAARDEVEEYLAPRRWALTKENLMVLLEPKPVDPEDEDTDFEVKLKRAQLLRLAKMFDVPGKGTNVALATAIQPAIPALKADDADWDTVREILSLE
jgi:hypothetical protein